MVIYQAPQRQDRRFPRVRAAKNTVKALRDELTMTEDENATRSMEKGLITASDGVPIELFKMRLYVEPATLAKRIF